MMIKSAREARLLALIQAVISRFQKSFEDERGALAYFLALSRAYGFWRDFCFASSCFSASSCALVSCSTRTTFPVIALTRTSSIVPFEFRMSKES